MQHHAITGQTTIARHRNQSLEVTVRTVHTTIADKSHQMQNAATLLGVAHSAHESFIREKRPVGNRLIDAGDLLPNNPPGANIQVADLTVAHQPARQTNFLAAAIEGRRRITLAKIQPASGSRQGDRIGFGCGCFTESIENDQSQWGPLALVHVREAPRPPSGSTHGVP